MNALPAILICEHDALFLEALGNLLLAAGYSRVDVVATVREALAKLRRERYSHILVGLSRPLLINRQRLARVVQQRQPAAEVVFLVSANDVPFITDTSADYVIKERAFSILLDAIAPGANHEFANPTKRGSQ